uniref:Uncharacterized protein n=1 Tax=Rhizophora mucronata TaxID=61149 RepID=A0A2P2N1H2_RHIMU
MLLRKCTILIRRLSCKLREWLF